MALGSLLLFLALLIIVALILARPLIEGQGEVLSMDESSRWLAERERILDVLAELDADWQLGKIPEEIYASQRELLVAKGARAIEEIEKEDKHRVAAQEGDDLDELIAAYRAKQRAHR